MYIHLQEKKLCTPEEALLDAARSAKADTMSEPTKHAMTTAVGNHLAHMYVRVTKSDEAMIHWAMQRREETKHDAGAHSAFDECIDYVIEKTIERSQS